MPYISKKSNLTLDPQYEKHYLGMRVYFTGWPKKLALQIISRTS